MKRRFLTTEEKKLWETVTNQVKPLHPNDDEQGADTDDEGILPAPTTAIRIKPHTTRAPAPKTPAPTLGNYAGIDRNTATRFKKGQYPLDGTLDLHGMTRDKAHAALVGFIESHYARGSRCLLVITGKGRQSDSEEHGILRRMLPGWLDNPTLSSMILALATATQKHGGAGAYYILLKRKR